MLKIYTEQEFKAHMLEFPCTFHLDFKHVSKNRIKERRYRLDIEINNSCEEIRKMNLLVWIDYRLGKYKKALDLIEQTKTDFMKNNNIISISNMAYVMWNNGNEFKASECLEKLKQLKSSPIFPSLLLEAQAEMAFSYKKIGGSLNLSRAIELYIKVVETKPEDMAMKLELGITYRRTTHPTISKSTHFKNDSLINRIQKAADLFFIVIKSNAENKFRSRAFIELAVMRRHTHGKIDMRKYHEICRDMSIRKLCLEALKISEDDSRILCECGRILHEFDWNSAIEVLEKSVQMMPHTVAYHHLGMAYEKRSRRFHAEKLGLKWKSISHEPKSIVLDWDDNDVQKALKYYQEAILISKEDNVSAMYNCGQLLKSCVQLEDAIVQFNKVIRCTNYSNHPSEREHCQYFNVVAAFEQIGLCYLAWYRLDTGQCDISEVWEYKNKSETIDDIETDASTTDKVSFNYLKLTNEQLQLKESAESKFMQAISLAARYAKEAPHDYEINVWKSFLILEEKYSKNDFFKLFELMKLCGKHGEIFQLVEDLKNHDTEQLKQPRIFSGALESYMALRKYETGLAFMNLIIPYVAKNDHEDIQTLEIQVNLCAAASRLEHPEECPGDLFQHVLDLQFWGKCPNVETLQQENFNDDVKKCAEESNYLDVLILYDDEDCSFPLTSSTKAQQLKKLIKRTYNLNVKCNKERNPVGLLLYPEEMLFYKAVVVLLEDKHKVTNDGLFNAHLKYIPLLSKECSERQRTVPTISLVLTSRFPESNIPLELKVYKYVYFDDIIQTQSTKPCKIKDRDRSSDEGLSPINNHVPSFKRNPLVNENVNSAGPEFSSHVTSLMTCFCHLMLNRDWPSCQTKDKKG